LPRAQYQLSNNGHFGLGKDVYCHFTSPIRRYPDLLVHQQLLARDLGKTPRTASTLAELANACNAREQNVDQAAFAASDRLKLRHLANQVTDRAAACLEGVIFRVTNGGLTVYLEEYGLMGFLDIRHLGEDVWQCDEKRLTLVHRYSGEKRRFGDTIYVRPLVVDTVRNDLQLAPAGVLRDF
jgi:ribonuclease R